MSDLIERLRDAAIGIRVRTGPMCDEAAQVLSRLTAEVESLRAERDTFYMDYRTKADEETKRLTGELAAMRADAENWRRYVRWEKGDECRPQLWGSFTGEERLYAIEESAAIAAKGE